MDQTDVIKTRRFVLKPLLPRHASQIYLAWLQDSASSRYISAAKKIKQIQDLQNYIKQYSRRNNCIFLRILTKKTNNHIGNIKYHPIDFERRTAVMGILIGEPTWRGKGVAKEVLKLSAKHLQSKAKIQKIYLGVRKDNLPAIQAYQKVGFKTVGRWEDGRRPNRGQKIMVWNLT